MYKKRTYILSFLPGTDRFVSEELKEKYPDVEILSHNSQSITFSFGTLEIETFRNLYSPIYIESEGKKLNLFRRSWKKKSVSAGLNPSLAYILCTVADLREEDILLDPFCGASTIPITALKYFNVKRVLCSDISGSCIEKSQKNFDSAKISKEKYKLFKSDVGKTKLNKQNVDKVVTNLPFGIRASNHERNTKAYYDFEKLLKKVLRKKGLVVVLTQEKVLLRKVFNKEKWLVKSLSRINEGGLQPEIFKISRR